MPFKTIYLVRHGQSLANAGGITSYNATIPLTDLGKIQASEFASSNKIIPDLILVSPYLRAKETASPLILKLPQVKVEELFIIHEMNNLSQAKCANMTVLERKPMVDKYWSDCNTEYIDGDDAESFATFISRVQLFVKILENKVEKNIMVFGHGRFFQALIWCLINNNFLPSTDMMRKFVYFFNSFPITNIEINTLFFYEQKWFVGK